MEGQHPRLKDFAWVAVGSDLTLTQDAGIEIVIEQPEPQLLDLLHRLDGTTDVGALTGQMTDRWEGVQPVDVTTALESLDALRALEDARATTILTEHQQLRYASNLAFFGTFATLAQSRFSFQERLCRATVLVLGAGGVGSAVLASLSGLGVHSVEVVDDDVIDLRNLVRQFLYTEADIGETKVTRAVARVQALNSDTRVSGCATRIAGPADVSRLLTGADLVISTIDEPAEVQSWVNEACVGAEVPFITGGVWAQRAQYLSVDPGTSGCLRCLDLVGAGEPGDILRSGSRVNRGVGPMTSLLAGLMAMEAARFLAGFATPVAAGRAWTIDAATGRVEPAGEWARLDACPVCCVLPDRAERASRSTRVHE
jgi:molybdopterin/thiamine biosynthesis adenylyltransferase